MVQKTQINVPSKIDGKSNPTYHKQYYLSRRDVLLRRSKNYQQKHMKTVLQKNKKWVANNRKRHTANQRNSYLKRTYGISLDEYNELFQQQNGLCALCGNPQHPYSQGNGRVVVNLSVDHDHTTGRVRSLLCQFCNQLLGTVERKPELIQRMFQYLVEHSKGK